MPCPDVSICFVNWRTPDDLIACVRSIEAAPPRYEYDIRIVDNASGDGSPERLAECVPSANLILNEGNVGFGRAANQAIRETRGRYVLLLNPDVIVREGAVDALVGFMDETPRAGACGGTMRSPKGRRHHSCRRFPTSLAAAFRGTPLSFFVRHSRYEREYLMEGEEFEGPTEVDWLSGSCLMLRRAVLDEVGVFDERYFMYLEDTDLCYRMHQAGWGVYYVPGAEFVHTIGRSSDQAQVRMIVAHHRSMLVYYRKNLAATVPLPLRPLYAVGVIARCLVILTKNRLMRWRAWRVSGAAKT